MTAGNTDNHRPADVAVFMQLNAARQGLEWTHMRTVFHEQLDAETAVIADMCDLAGRAMQGATQALLQADLVLAESVIGEHDEIMLNAARAEHNAFALLALQAPVAGDLRIVIASLKNAADADRMGALALHVAKIVRRRHPAHAVPEEVNSYFAEMGRIAVDLSNNAKDVVQSGDPRKAAQLSDDDDAMDDLHRKLFSLLMDRNWKHGVASAVDVTLLGRYYERFADHAVQIGRRVVFQATGTIRSSI
jgi:phosphate transport system protein